MAELPIKSLYLHYPFCKNLCNYCDFYKGLPSVELELSYEEQLSEMFKAHHSFLLEGDLDLSVLKTMYIGGGTPSLWGSKGALYIERKLKEYGIAFENEYEFTMELNPGDWHKDDVENWVSIGVNRVSVGIQSINPNFLKVLDRVHSIEDVYETLSFLKSSSLNFSVDFMIGLPFSEKYKRDIIAELEEILSYGPNHISLYILTVGENYKYLNDLPSDEFIEQEYLKTAEFLKRHGFEHYEVSNFSKPGLESKHNLAYWNMESVAAIGPSATGFISQTKTRYKWKTKRAAYQIENLSQNEYLLEEVYMSLRINRGLPLDYFKTDEFARIAQNWEHRGLGIVKNGRIILNSRGFLVLDSLMNELFVELKNCF